ncbi:MAG TPA: peptidoglycan-binding protein LysM [Geminicoccus sp.]|uniref:peptidoglycan-binding protein LysM n=1 Tax=Geminicoccus sp. TaxID=2024832 RepID=UPI002C0A54A8|nr:peptidoglycan-binding protein LysM [Geminicoccus sp.]HWL70161.1 peptidoglycan-binding protein LysM [Geminicoccus sp.]
MGLIDFVKAAGRSLGIGTADAAPTADELKKEAESHGLDVSGLDVAVDGDKVTVKGGAKSQEEKEKIILAMGNVAGVAKVEDQIAPAAAAPADSASFYTVKKGDTLSAIAKAQYGDASKYPVIFEANKPMLKHPDKIYPGQVLRIPKQA